MLSIRQYRVFNIAIFDLILSFIGMIIIFLIAKNKYYKELNTQNFVLASLFVTIPISILFHVIFGINTQLNYNLGLSNKPER